MDEITIRKNPKVLFILDNGLSDMTIENSITIDTTKINDENFEESCNIINSVFEQIRLVAKKYCAITFPIENDNFLEIKKESPKSYSYLENKIKEIRKEIK